MLLHWNPPPDHLSVNSVWLLLQSVIPLEFNAGGWFRLFRLVFTAAVCFESLKGQGVVASKDQEQSRNIRIWNNTRKYMYKENEFSWSYSLWSEHNQNVNHKTFHLCAPQINRFILNQILISWERRWPLRFLQPLFKQKLKRGFVGGHFQPWINPHLVLWWVFSAAAGEFTSDWVKIN